MESKIVVKQTKTRGRGLFAARDIKKSEIVTVWHPKKIISKKEMKLLSKDEQCHTTGIANGKHIVMGIPERYINHSCNPNTFVKDKKDVALRDIKKGEEITSDYAVNSVDDWEFRCLCGSRNCRKKICGDFFKLPKKWQKKYLPVLDKEFKEKFGEKLKKLI